MITEDTKTCDEQKAFEEFKKEFADRIDKELKSLPAPSGPVGWICPRCGGGLSPYTSVCPNCAPPMRITCTTTAYTW